MIVDFFLFFENSRQDATFFQKSAFNLQNELHLFLFEDKLQYYNLSYNFIHEITKSNTERHSNIIILACDGMVKGAVSFILKIMLCKKKALETTLHF